MVPKVSDHQLLHRIGAGAYGEVWLAISATGVRRAVKVISRSRFEDSQPFDREFEGIKRFEPVSRDHPALVDILHVGRDDEGGSFFYVMELADSAAGEGDYVPKTLKSVLDDSRNRAGKEGLPMPLEEVLHTARSLASSLAHLHKNGLVHRDIKPANVIFVGGIAKLADIGLVTTSAGVRTHLGTEDYIAPEGSGAEQGDLYSLGKLLFEMVTGLPVKEWPRLPMGFEKLGNEFRELNRIVMRATSGDRAQRYSSAQELLSDLEAVGSERVRRAERTVRRQRVMIVGIVATVIATAFWTTRQRGLVDRWNATIRDVDVARLSLRTDPWFSNLWASVEKAADIRMKFEVKEQAATLLTGFDARAVVSARKPSTAAAFSADGSVVISGGEGKNGMLISKSGKISELPFSGEGPVVWNTSGTPLQLTALSNTIILRNATNGDVVRMIGSFKSETVPILALSSKSEFAVAANDGEIRAWDTRTGELISRTREVATALAISPDAGFLAVGRVDGITQVYSLPDLDHKFTLPPASRGSQILALTFGRNPTVYESAPPESKWFLATGDQGATIVIWDLGKKVPRILKGSTFFVSALAFSPDGCTLASAGRNQPRVWDIATGLPLLKLSQTSSGATMALTFDSTGRKLLVGGVAEAANPITALVELEPDRGIQTLRGLTAPIRKVWISPNGGRIAALSDDWQLAVWDTDKQWLERIFEVPVGNFPDDTGGAFSPDGKKFAFASLRDARIYDLNTGRSEATWRLDEGLPNEMQFTENGTIVLVRGEPAFAPKSKWRAYSLSPGKERELISEQSEEQGAIEGLELSPDAKWFLAGIRQSRGGRISRIDLDGRELWSQQFEKLALFRFSIEANARYFGYIANFHNHDELRVLSTQDSHEVARGFFEKIGPDAKLFSGNGILVIPASNGEELLPVTAQGHALRHVSAFSRDGKKIVCGTGSGHVIVAKIEEVRARMSTLGR